MICAKIPFWTHNLTNCLNGLRMEIDRQKLHDERYRREVLTILLRDYQDRIFRYCVNRLGEVHGEEVAQEVFVTAWESLPKFRQASAIETWLTGIAKNKCMQAFRNRTRRQRIVHDYVEEIRQHVHAEAVETPEHTTGAQGQLARLGQALARLRDDERLLLNLRYTRGLSIAELVELIGKSEAAVRKQLLRALQRLRQLMDDDASL